MVSKETLNSKSVVHADILIEQRILLNMYKNKYQAIFIRTMEFFKERLITVKNPHWLVLKVYIILFL